MEAKVGETRSDVTSDGGVPVLREIQEGKIQQPLIVWLEIRCCELPKCVFDNSGMYSKFCKRMEKNWWNWELGKWDLIII